MGFRNDKLKALGKYSRALEDGKVDKPIIDLINYINSFPDYYTTSSCAGRVIFLHEFGKRKIDNDFVVKEHENVNIDDFLNVSQEGLTGRVWLKQEPFIIHIACRTLTGAEEMLDIGIKSGLKHSGLFVFKPERYILELNGTDNISTPVMDGGKPLVSKDYLVYLLKLADEKLQRNKEFRLRFERDLREKFK
jgi:tRNA wybutosine-synthesizing protein 3